MKRLISALILLVFMTSCYGLVLADILRLPAGVVEIGNEAFQGTGSLETVDVPWGTETIGSRAFAQSGAMKVFLPNTVRSIAEDAFEGTNAVMKERSLQLQAFTLLLSVAVNIIQAALPAQEMYPQRSSRRAVSIRPTLPEATIPR